MIKKQDLIGVFQTMYREHWPYEWGAARKGCVDCSGAFTYSYSLFKQTCPHGSNAMARKMIVGELLPISKARPGMVGFKAKKPGEEGYDLKPKYLPGGSDYNGDLTDYSHVGLVDDDPQYILNAKSTKYGFCRDKLTAKNGWDYVAYLKGVEYEEEDPVIEVTYQAKVIGGRLSLRKEASTNSDRICWMPEGSIVTVTGDQSGWSRVEYNGQQGWAKSEYLEEVREDPGEMISVPRKQLEDLLKRGDAIWNELADLMGGRG